MKYQDIHLVNKKLQTNIKTLWGMGRYKNVISLVTNPQMSEYSLNADTINDITTVITTLENQKDDSFKTDKIKVASEPPADLADGGVYFKLIRQTSDYGEAAQLVEMTQKDGIGYTSLYPITYASNVDVPRSVSTSGSLDDIMAVLASYFISG